jgi:hypothetical protein
MSGVPVQKTFQLFGQLDQALGWLSLNIRGRFAKVWGDVFGRRLGVWYRCGGPLQFSKRGSGIFTDFRALVETRPFVVFLFVEFRACVAVTFLYLGIWLIYKPRAGF